ncbi:MAG: nitrogenase component 1 [Methanomethylophilus sp.]|jgi:nitrogenase iron protein NifH
MARRIAIYGKGGIGKSTVSSNLTAALSDMGVRVLQVGCDPKHDSTRSLLGGNIQNTVLDYVKSGSPKDRKLGDVVAQGYKGCLCVEAGGPEPGVGCAGRGIISAFDLLESLGADALNADLTLYDVLGDVVCGGFAVPMRTKYADTVYIVTSGEFMSIYAANNILKGAANYGGERIGGLIFNSRGDPEEKGRVEAFSQAVGVPIIASIERSQVFMDAERLGQTVVQAFPESPVAGQFRDLAKEILKAERHPARFLKEDKLEQLILGRATKKVEKMDIPEAEKAAEKKRTPYASRSVEYGEPLNGCAFSGASSVCTSIEGLATVLHAPASCAHFTVQLDSSCVRGAARCGYATVRNFEDPDVECTFMDEKSMIFGGNDVLRKAIESRIESGAKDIAVITACPPGIIGDPVVQICKEEEEAHPGTTIVPVIEDGNAAGDFMQGVIDAGVELVRRFAEKGDRMPYTVNLVGSKTMSSTTQSEIAQIESYLKRMGIAVNCILPGMATMEGLRKAGRASADLMLNPDVFSDKLCVFMENEFNVPRLKYPVAGGIEGASRWLREVGKYFGREREAEAVIGDLKAEFEASMAGPREVLKGKTCVIVSLNHEVSWIKEAAEASGMRILKGYIINRSDYADDLSQFARSEDFEDVGVDRTGAVVKAVSELHPDIVAAPAAMDIDPSIYQARLPCAPAADPFAGRWLAEDWARGMLAPAREGWWEDL